MEELFSNAILACLAIFCHTYDLIKLFQHGFRIRVGGTYK